MSKSKSTIISIQKSKEDATNAIFLSVNERGLRPLNMIPTTILTNPVTHANEGNICVNYVNLVLANEKDAALALDVAVNEEYCGIYGICLERQWPFQRFNSPELLKLEASERLMNSVVFILAPPEKNPEKSNEVHAAQKPTQIAFYEKGKTEPDGFSQSRGRSIITGKEAPYSNRVTEIKTIHQFTKKEVLAVLVPEHLQSMATAIFTTLPIIAVGTKILTLNSLPRILMYYHDELLKKPLTVEAPDYLDALNKFCAKKGTVHFSLHAVRLHTTFDFTVRPITQVKTAQRLIDSSCSSVAVNYEDDSAWLIVHKNFAIPKQKIITNLKERTSLPERNLSKFEKGCQSTMALCTELTKLKGEALFSIVHGELSFPQLSLLADLGVKVIKLDHFYALNYLPKVKKEVTNVVEQFKSIQESAALKIQSRIRGYCARTLFQKSIQEDAALKIQTHIRGYRVRTFFQEVQEKREQLKKAQEELTRAHDKLASLSRGVSQ